VAAAGTSGGQRKDTGWEMVPLRLEALLPLVAASRTVGNVVESMDFLPGTYLLPPLMGRLLEMGLNEPTLRQALAAGDIIVLPATPEVAGERGLPIPFCLFQAKDRGIDQEPAYNRLIEPEPCGVQLKGFRDGFLNVGEADRAVYAKTRKTLRTHNSIHDATQRPKREKNEAREGVGVYSYEAIAPGTVLRSELRLRSSIAKRLAELHPDWWAFLEGEYYVGRSKKDDYGLVRVVAEKPQSLPALVDIEEPRQIVVWLTSPAILRSNTLRPSGFLDDLRQELERRLRIKLQRPADSGDDGKDGGPLDHVILPFRWDSWHVGWGLPRPSLAGLQGGSCARFVLEGDVPGDLPALLAEVQAAGIGERRAEGFGQVWVNPPLLSQGRPRLRTETEAAKAGKAPDGGLAPPAVLRRSDASPKELEFAHLLERALWRDRIRRLAYELAWKNQGAENPLGISTSEPSASQLGNLRALVRRLRSWDDAAQAIRWLERLGYKGKQEADKGWPEKSLEALKDLFSDSNEIWRWLNQASSPETPPFPVLTEDGADVLRKDLWAEAVQALVEATADFRRASSAAAGQGGVGRGTAR
jgi:CRISPR-associated protein Csx10